MPKHTRSSRTFDYDTPRLEKAILSALDNSEPKQDIINAFNCGLMGVKHRLVEITDKVKKCRKKTSSELCKYVMNAIDGWEKRQTLPTEEELKAWVDEKMLAYGGAKHDNTK